MAKLNKKSRAIAKAMRVRRAAMEAQFNQPNNAADYAFSKTGMRQHGGIGRAYCPSVATAARVKDGTAPTGRFERPKKK